MTETALAPVDMTAPPPGRYLGVTDAVYHAWTYHSRSNLNLVLRSPAHFKAAQENPEEPSPDMVFGCAAHAAYLQPDRFDLEYYSTKEGAPEAPEKPESINRRTKVGKEEYIAWVRDVLEPWERDVLAPWKAARLHKTSVPDALWQRIPKLCAALDAEPAAVALLRAGPAEVSYVWDEPTIGFCRCRPDVEAKDSNLLVDLKTTVDARPEAFAKSIARFHYHRQAAWYLRGANAVHGAGTFTRFAFVAVEKTPPYGVGVYVLDERDIARGEAEMELAIKRLAWCLERDDWPGYGRKITPIGLPTWARREIDEGIQA